MPDKRAYDIMAILRGENPEEDAEPVQRPGKPESAQLTGASAEIAERIRAYGAGSALPGQAPQKYALALNAEVRRRAEERGISQDVARAQILRKIEELQDQERRRAIHEDMPRLNAAGAEREKKRLEEAATAEPREPKPGDPYVDPTGGPVTQDRVLAKLMLRARQTLD
ncbi:hypothetical protein ACFXPT_10955 [Streptomyces goshikiensis]|uniref:hypothetical protein n=1 Tax=Streptomyces goshikiensis TaxID=1942 RepID=UPI00367C0B99